MQYHIKINGEAGEAGRTVLSCLEWNTGIHCAVSRVGKASLKQQLKQVILKMYKNTSFK